MTPKLLKFLFLPLIKLAGRAFCAGRCGLFLPFGIEEAPAELGLPGANAVSPIDIVTEPVRADGEIVVVAGDVFGEVGLELFEFILAKESPCFRFLKEAQKVYLNQLRITVGDKVVVVPDVCFWFGYLLRVLLSWGEFKSGIWGFLVST